MEDLYFFLFGGVVYLYFVKTLVLAFEIIKLNGNDLLLVSFCVAHHHSVKEKKSVGCVFESILFVPHSFRWIMTFNNLDILSIHARCPISFLKPIFIRYIMFCTVNYIILAKYLAILENHSCFEN